MKKRFFKDRKASAEETPQDPVQVQEADLERTDRLPVLDVATLEHDAAGETVSLDTTSFAGSLAVAAQSSVTDFPRPVAIDLPSLAESVRSVEERIARQHAEHEALQRAYERACNAETEAVRNASAIAAELASVRLTLEAEQARSRDLDRSVVEKAASGEVLLARVEESRREADRALEDARVLKESLSARDATVMQLMQSVGERDSQLMELQRDHAKLVPVLEERSRTSTQLESELQGLRAQHDSVSVELASSQKSLAALALQVKRGEYELGATRQELSVVKAQSTSYLEVMRTREWRKGLNQNIFRELDAAVGAAQAGAGELESQRNELKRQLDALTEQVASQVETIAKLEAAGQENATALGQRAEETQKAEHTRQELAAQVASLESEVARLNSLLSARDATIESMRQTALTEAQRVKDSLAATDKKYAEQSLQVDRLRGEAEKTQQEMAVLIAHLQESRRPIETVEADLRRMTEELAAKTASFEAMEEEHRKLTAALDRTRGALEEREFLIRRLERSESNNANVLGRIQTSIERLGSPSVPLSPATALRLDAEMTAELIRVDGETPQSYVLGRRTRIGRAQGCELHIDSSSVSRHHALVLTGPRDAIIEDLNSTNGVYVNGRKATRQMLHDGDVLTIGEAKFKFAAKPVQAAETVAAAAAQE